MVAMAIIGIIYIIWRLVDESRANVVHPGKMNFQRMQEDTTAQAMGKLSKSEAKKRLYNGYYMDK